MNHTGLLLIDLIDFKGFLIMKNYIGLLLIDLIHFKGFLITNFYLVCGYSVGLMNSGFAIDSPNFVENYLTEKKGLYNNKMLLSLLNMTKI